MPTSKKFSFQPSLIGSAFKIRPLQKSDYPLIAECASDKEIWAGHPATNRHEPEVFKILFDDSINSKACMIFIEIDTGNIAGWSRYYVADDGPEDISIGYTFLTKTFWGGEANFEIKSLLINYALQFYERIWFHIAPMNIRSRKATEKLGAKFSHEAPLSLAGQKPSLTQSFVLEKSDWSMINK